MANSTVPKKKLSAGTGLLSIPLPTPPDTPSPAVTPPLLPVDGRDKRPLLALNARRRATAGTGGQEDEDDAGDGDDDELGLAQRLRLATAHAHDQVMLPPVVHELVKGQLPRPAYLRYLTFLHGVYTELDGALERHPTHRHLSQVYDPRVLARATSLDDDCAWFAGTRDWQDAHGTVPRVVQEYKDRLRSLGVADEDAELGDDGTLSPTLLLAHAYVRYLGDLSGGQSIAKSLRKAYSLPDTGEGSAFYEFFLPDTQDANGLPRRAGPIETKQIKTWFRRGLDAAGQDMTELERLKVIDEAVYAFKLNMGLFQSLADEVSEGVHAQASRPSVKAKTRPGFAVATVPSVALLLVAIVLSLYLR